jgi:hypothetical protein
MSVLASHEYASGGLEAALEFLKRTRGEMRALHRVRVWKDRVEVVDVNKDIFEVRGIGYPDPDVIPVLQYVNTAFNPETIHVPVDVDYKEFGAGRRYTWAADRLM